MQTNWQFPSRIRHSWSSWSPYSKTYWHAKVSATQTPKIAPSESSSSSSSPAKWIAHFAWSFTICGWNSFAVSIGSGMWRLACFGAFRATVASLRDDSTSAPGDCLSSLWPDRINREKLLDSARRCWRSARVTVCWRRAKGRDILCNFFSYLENKLRKMYLTAAELSICRARWCMMKRGRFLRRKRRRLTVCLRCTRGKWVFFFCISLIFIEFKLGIFII